MTSPVAAYQKKKDSQGKLSEDVPLCHEFLEHKVNGLRMSENP